MSAREAEERARIQGILRKLRRHYGEAHCALEYQDAFQLTVATILSAQATDVRVNMTTPALFAKYPSPAALAAAPQHDVELLVKSCGFYRNKARNIIGMARKLVEDFGGEVPRTMEALLTLPGVARKTANVVLGNAFGIAAGVVVDTHVGRLSRRLGLSRETDPTKVESDLRNLVPRSRWIQLPHELIFHGRQVCIARNPKCGECPLAELCPSADTEGSPPASRRSAAEVLGHRPKRAAKAGGDR